MPILRSQRARTSPDGAGRGLIALAVVGALILAACGGGGDDDAVKDRFEAGVEDAATGADETADGADGDQAEADGRSLEGEANSHLPFDGEAPAGFRMVSNGCEAEVDGGDADAPADYSSPIGYSVPTGWTTGGRSSGGSGGTLGTDVDLRFVTADRSEVTIGYEWDTYGPDNVVHDWEGEPWKTFDYDSSVGDDEARIVYESVSMVTVEDRELELFYLDPTQAPNHVRRAEYKVRVPVMEIIDPNYGPSTPTEQSFVLTIEFPSELSEVTHETAEMIVGSLNMPSCRWDELITDQEMYRRIDLNGDGKIKTVDEGLAEMQDNLDELLAESEAELEGS